MQCADTIVSLKNVLIYLKKYCCAIFSHYICFNRGESAFHALMFSFGWAKNPMVKRMHKLSDDIPITLLYGSKSWVDNSAGEMIMQYRPSSYVNVQVRKLH